MKKFILIYLLIFILGVFLFSSYNNSPRTVLSKIIKEDHIKSGKLIYRIYLFNFLPVAEAAFDKIKEENLEDKEVYRLSVQAKTTGFISRLFNLSASLNSYIDRQQFTPVLFTQDLISPGKEKAKKQIIYKQEQGTMVSDNIERKIYPDTYDPLSALYHIRHTDFEQINNLAINVNSNQKNYLLQSSSRIEDLSIKNKLYEIVIAKAEIKRRDKTRYHKTNITIILLKDEENLPILIKIFTSGLMITARLTDIR